MNPKKKENKKHDNNRNEFDGKEKINSSHFEWQPFFWNRSRYYRLGCLSVVSGITLKPCDVLPGHQTTAIYKMQAAGFSLPCQGPSWDTSEEMENERIWGFIFDVLLYFFSLE